MKRIVYLFAALLTMATVKVQTLTEHEVQEGASNEWCEPVDDATYNALK